MYGNIVERERKKIALTLAISLPVSMLVGKLVLRYLQF